MVWVEIIEIKNKEWKGKLNRLAFFHYNKRGIDELQYTYINNSVTKYWQKYFKNSDFDFKVGMMINVFNVPNSNMYTIKGVKLENE